MLVRPDFEKYRAVSQQVFEIFRAVTPLVEPLSLDEAYLDVTENAWGEPLGMTVARRIKAAIREATGLTASAGVAPNKFLAKIASGWKKPDGLTVIAPERVEAFLQRLPVDALSGVGPVTAKRLRAIGVTKAVRPADDRRGGARAGGRQRRRAGWSSSRTESTTGRSSPIGPRSRRAPKAPTRRTSSTSTRIRDEIAAMAARGGRVARAARAVRPDGDHQGALLRLHDDHAQPLGRAGDARRDDLVGRALALLDRTEAGRRPVRLLGVIVHNLAEVPGEALPARRPKPLPLFDDDEPCELTSEGTRPAAILSEPARSHARG